MRVAVRGATSVQCAAACTPATSATRIASAHRTLHTRAPLLAPSTSSGTPAKEGDPSKLALTLQHLTKRFGGSPGRTLFKDVNLSFYHGAKIGILGANGCGKSSFLKILAGLDSEIDGTVRHRDGGRGRTG